MSCETVTDDASGLVKYRLTTAAGHTAEVFKHGAHVTSWRDLSGNELLFVSKKVRHNAVAEWRNLGVTPSVAQALYQPPKAIRGGVPICWPQFSDFGSLSQHGFARNKQWDFVTAGADADGTGALVELSLCDTDETRAVWPHSFKLTMTVHLTGAGTLRCDLGVTNTGSDELAFTAALHTYFRCDAQKSMVRGLHGCEYLDSLKGRQRFTQSDEAVSFDGEVDRIYLGASQSPLSLIDSSHSRTFSVAASNMPDAVVWNPHIAKAKAMADFDDDEWLEMVCIEPAVVQQPIILAPNASWKGSQLLEVDARCM